MNKKVVTIGSFAISLAVGLATIFSATNNYYFVNAINDEVWYHYSAVEPTENVHGSIEFWASSANNCKTFVLEEPSEGQIIDKDFSINPHFDELTFADERYIPSLFEERNAVYPIATGVGYFKYGIYPDVVVSDSELISVLNKLEEDSDIDGWYLYDGVYYTSIITSPTSGAIYHNGKIIPQNAKNWFKCSPIAWRQLEDINGDKFLLADDLLDVFRYDNSSSDYMTSDIRRWLNDDFYNKAFALGNEYIKLTLTNDNLDPEAPPSIKNYDNVFLLTFQNYTNQNYGFNSNPGQSDNKRACRTTDYTRASGAHLSSDGAYYGRYFTRTPSPLEPETHAFQINDEGQMYGYTVDDANSGVRPGITINFNIN